MKKWLLAVLAIAITTVWVVSSIAAIFLPGYNPPVAIQSLMMTVAGGIFGKLIRQLQDDDP